MDNELDIIQLRLVIRSAVDCLSKDSIAINEVFEVDSINNTTAKKYFAVAFYQSDVNQSFEKQGSNCDWTH